MMAAIQLNNNKGQVTQLFSSPVTSAEREVCLDDGDVKDVSMHAKESPSEKCDTASTNEENGIGQPGEEDGEEAVVSRRSSSVLEAKERAHNCLRDELQKAQQELKLKDKECQKLHQVQEKMGEELEELTASLFEEANKMVQDANIRRMQAEKLLKEANAKIDVLQAEVTALKTLVITSTPSMPNKHLHPQLEPKKDEFVKGHRRSTSHHNFSKEMRVKEVTFLQEAPPESFKPVQRELDPVYYEEFRCWKVMPTMAQSCVFLSHIISEDVLPCLGFANRELARSVFECVMDNSLTIEPVPHKHPSPGLPQSPDDPSCKCALVNSNCACKYRIKLDDSQQWYFISQLARNRITAVCDFMTYIRYITQGLVKSDVRDMYWEIIRLRQQMALARLGLS